MHKEIRNTLAWIIMASFVMFTAVWQAQVSAAKDLEARKRELPPPAKTKRAVRPVPQPFSGDVVADYIARCEKGLTDQEIGWILEDFKNAGLDLEITDNLPHTALFTLHAAQSHWYRNAVVDGLRLNSQQSDQIAAALTERASVAKDKFIEAINSESRPYKQSTTSFDYSISETYAGYTTAYLWLLDAKDPQNPSVEETYMPWKLCTLTPDQERITWKRWFDSRESIRVGKSDPPLPNAEAPSDDLRSQFLLSKPDVIPSGEESHKFEQDILWSNAVFPLFRNQKLMPRLDVFANNEGRLLANVRLLHPAQLNIMLLLLPQLAGQIQQDLEAESR